MAIDLIVENEITPIVVSLHNFFDFDLQYMVMMMLFILCLDYDSGKVKVIKTGKNAVCTAVGVLCALCAYLGIGQTAYYLDLPQVAYNMNNGDTLAAMHVLLREKDSNKASELAEVIIDKNEYCAIAYSAKANAAFSKGDVVTAMECKRKVLELTPFEYEEYEQYCKILVYCIQMYTDVRDTNSAEVCRRELITTVTKLESLESKLSTLGKMIKDQPKTQLVGEIAYYVKEYTKND